MDNPIEIVRNFNLFPSLGKSKVFYKILVKHDCLFIDFNPAKYCQLPGAHLSKK